MAYRSSMRTIISKYPAKCCCCGGDIPAGRMVDYDRKRGWIGHYKSSQGDSSECYGVLRAKQDPGFVDLDRAYEDQCADICGR